MLLEVFRRPVLIGIHRGLMNPLMTEGEHVSLSFMHETYLRARLAGPRVPACGPFLDRRAVGACLPSLLPNAVWPGVPTRH